MFTYDTHTFVKRLQKIGKKMLVILDNKTADYRDWEFDREDNVYIHGRVVFSLSMKMRKW
ncbi:hypothetical protein IFE17_05920 [Actinobacillus sp. GY-402]|nr:hypothetical protein IFE17_05920 [Actinobacillus sp. GY-402]